MQNNRNILIVILIVLVGVFILMYNNKTGFFHKETTGEKISNSVNEITEEIGDEIDDNTTSK